MSVPPDSRFHFPCCPHMKHCPPQMEKESSPLHAHLALWRCILQAGQKHLIVSGNLEIIKFHMYNYKTCSVIDTRWGADHFCPVRRLGHRIINIYFYACLHSSHTQYYSCAFHPEGTILVVGKNRCFLFQSERQSLQEKQEQQVQCYYLEMEVFWGRG